MEQFTLLILQIIEIGMNLPDSLFTSQMNRHTSILSMNYYRPIEAREEREEDYERRRAGEDEERIIRVAKHKDVSMLTVVSQCCKGAAAAEFVDCPSSSSGGGDLELLIEDPASAAEAEEGGGVSWQSMSGSYATIIVHIGDCLEDWTRGRLRSVSHRVTSSASDIASTVGGSGMERYSLAYFASPNHDARMSLRDASSSASSAATTTAAATEEDKAHKSMTYARWRKQHIKKACSIQRKNQLP